MDCCYGCGNEALFIFKNGKQCCSKTKNQCSAIRTKISQKSMGRTLSKIQITKLNNFRELKLIEMKQFYLDCGCELLEDEYKNVHTKMKYRCKCGNINISAYHDFKHSKQCKNCSFDKVYENQRLGIDNAKKIFSDGGCICLENEYINSYALMRYICSCGNESKISLNNFKKGNRCVNCGNKKFSEKRSGKNHHWWNPDRNQIELNEKLRNVSYKLVQRCLKKTNQSKTSKTENLLGYSKNQLLEHLQTSIYYNEWVNDPKNYHIDHIFPVRGFYDHGIHDPKIINSLDNIQILPAKENMKKKDKYDVNEFLNYLESKEIN